MTFEWPFTEILENMDKWSAFEMVYDSKTSFDFIFKDLMQEANKKGD